MKPKHFLFAFLVIGALVSWKYFIKKSEIESITCEKKGTNSQPANKVKKERINDLHDPSFKRLIASTLK